jgi:predicted DNA-binding protein
MRKTSVYLDENQAQRLARLAREEGRSQAEILREAVATYQPRSSQDRNFALAGGGFARIDSDPRAIADIPEKELLEGFGE